MRILAIIPARKGSKGVPGKNKKLLGGKPLIQYTFEAALNSNLLDKIVVSTDDDDILLLAKECGIEAPFKRPFELAQDNTPTLDVVKHAVDFFEQRQEHYDVVCLLQPTSPFRPAGLIDKAIEKFKSSPCDSLITVLQVPHEFNPHWVFVPDENNNLTVSTGDPYIIPRRQELPKAYFRDGSIYLSDIKLINNGSLLGGEISYLENDASYYVNIDTDKDWTIAERMCKEHVDGREN